MAIRNTHELERLRSGALAALGRMATQVAHELKNPLAGLRLYARHLEQRLAKTGDGDGAALAQKISGTVDHLAAVVSEITAFGRPPELHRAPVALHALLDECVSFAQARITTEGIEIFQLVTEDAMVGVAAEARRLSGSENLCLAGGVALNVLAREAFLADEPFQRRRVEQPPRKPQAADHGAPVALFRQVARVDRRHVAGPV